MKKKWYENIEESVINSSKNLHQQWKDDKENYEAIKAIFDLLAKE